MSNSAERLNTPDESKTASSTSSPKHQNVFLLDEKSQPKNMEKKENSIENDGSVAAGEGDYEVGWVNGEQDPSNPKAFSVARKWLIVIIVSTCSFCVTGASSIYTSTYEQMEAEFGNSREVSVLGLSLFVLGISFGPMLLGPLSEFYGRRPIYLVSWSLYVIWIIPQAVSQNIETTLVTRFLDGFAGSAFLAVSGGTVGDLFTKEHLQAPMALFTISPFVGPSAGPIIGGFINFYTHWRWTYYVLLIWAVVLLVAIVFFVPETYHPILLKEKAKRLRKETGNSRYLAPTEKVQKSVSSAIFQSLRRPFELLIHEFMCLNLCIFAALILGTVYLFFGAFPLVFKETHGFNLWQIGLTFGGLGAGMLAGIATDPLWHRIRGNLVKKLEEETGVKGASEPEFRLVPAIFGAFLCPAGLFVFGWSSYSWVHWIVPILGATLFGAGTVLIFTGIFTFLVDAYPLYAASALAANTFVRCLFGTAFPLFGNQMYQKLGFQWASSLLAFLTLVMLPFPYIFFKYGKRIRAKSRYAKN